jgi:hypothetical protein
MVATLDSPIRYQLQLGEESVPLNELIGQKISLRFQGKINCVVCGRTTRKSFAQGFCYPCMMNSPQNSECIIRPELCRGHLGEGRDPEWEAQNHVCEHIVYLATSSEFKVGVTRGDQVPTRWIDQGATSAAILARMPHRRAAGELEVALKNQFTDRTSWQKMLKNDVMEDPDWDQAFQTARDATPKAFQTYLVEPRSAVVNLSYPVKLFPTKVKSLSFDKTELIEGTLLGIKGQYLLFDDNRVLNIRKHNGYTLRFEA